MGVVKQIEIKNRTQYFYRNMISLENFDSNLLKIDKKHYKGINIYYIGYITIKKIDDCENIYSVNPLYLLVNHANRYIEEKMEINTVDDTADENKELLKKYAYVWDGIKYEIKTINRGKKWKWKRLYEKFHAMTIIIRSVFEEDGKLYPQIFLDEALYEL